MPKKRTNQHIDQILQKWPYDLGEVNARQIAGSDGRNVLQLRIEMGLLQMETTGRPDGGRPHDAETYYDYLVEHVFDVGDDFVLNDDQSLEIDREFVQYYHRRISWLSLGEYSRAVDDADHTLALMDLCKRHSPDEDWTLSHEQYRPFVLFHRIQAAAFMAMEEDQPQKAVDTIRKGLATFRELFAEYDAEEQFDRDELVGKLSELRDTIKEQHDIVKTLDEQLCEAIDAEQYERAAELRDQITQDRPHSA